MPELPEVQTCVNYLNERIVGLKILACGSNWSNTIATHTLKALSKNIIGKQVISVKRRGKYIVIALSPDQDRDCLLIHLRMSGSVDILSCKLKRSPHDHFWIEFNNAKELRFNDVRKFGKVYFCKTDDSRLLKLGVEPLSTAFSSVILKQLLSDRSGAIKPFLLNQTFIAGIGNIYADECLWRAKIHPKNPAKKISDKKVAALHKAIVSVLKEAIELAGTDNGDNVVHGGMYKPSVYGQDNLPCPRCQTKIRKIFLAQRGTHFCPKCQRLAG